MGRVPFQGPHPKLWFSKGNPLISGKSRLVKYYNLARYIEMGNPFQDASCHQDHYVFWYIFSWGDSNQQSSWLLVLGFVLIANSCLQFATCNFQVLNLLGFSSCVQQFLAKTWRSKGTLTWYKQTWEGLVNCIELLFPLQGGSLIQL